MAAPRRWSPGEQIVLRFVGHDDGVVIGQPQIVVRDSDDEIVLFQPAGVTIENRRHTEESARANAYDGARWDLPPTFVPALDTLRILPADASYAIELLYAFEGQPNPGYLPWAQPHGMLRGVKINFQAPFRRTRLGVDTTDNVLDLTMRDDLAWSWKDPEQLHERLEVGLTYPEEAVAFYAEAEEVIAQIEARCGHFAGELADWRAWRPDPDWGEPTLLAGWDTEPGFDHDLNRRVPLTSA